MTNGHPTPDDAPSTVDRARSFISERPYTSVGIAFLAGYVLAGALLSRATVRLVGMGLRLVSLYEAQQRLGLPGEADGAG